MKRLFTRCLLMTLLMVLGITTTMAQKSVLDESFASLPDGWSTAADHWSFSDGNAMFPNLPIEDATDTLFSPVVSLNGLENKPSVAITYANIPYNALVNELKVLYRASLSDEWSELQTFAEATDGQAKWKGALPEGLTQVQVALAAAYLRGEATRVYRLSIENKTEAADAPTNLKYEDLTSTSVTLWWDVCSSPMFKQYNVKVNSSKMTDMSATADIVDKVGWDITDEFYELSDLTPNQEYWLYVQYDCGDGDLSPWAELSFKTPCEAISGTFAEDFEGEISGCYTIIKGGAAAEVSGEYACNSQRSFKSNSSKGAYNYFILPEFQGEVKNFQVSFMAAAMDGGNTYARTVTVGVCTDATEASFTELKTLNLPMGRTWYQIVVTLKGYKGTGKYIAFKFGNEDKENRIFMDDIHIQTAEACPKPMFLEVYEVNPESAKLKWVETGDATEWNLVLSTKPLANPEDIEPDAAKGEFAGSISLNPYTATNLKPNTTYYAYVQAGCGSSEWTSAVEFKTSRPVTYPYSEHFDRMDPDTYDESTTNAIPNGWVMDDRCITSGSNFDKQYSSSTYRPFVTTKENHEQTAYVNAALKLSGASTTGYMSIAMLPAMPKPVNTMMITFWAKASNGNQTLKVGVANTQTNDLAQGQQLGVNIVEAGEATIIKDEWKQYKVLLTNYTGEGRYITLAPGAPYSGTPYIYIDDIEIDEAPDCNAVSSVSATATGIDKATVEWTDASSSTSWIIKVSSSEIDPSAADGDIVAAQTVSEKSYNITGLSMGGTYYIYVSPTCGDAWMSTSVTTLVGLQVPYYNDFTNENTGANANRGPKNWTLGFTYTDTPGATSSYWPHVNTTAWTNAPADVVKNSVYFNNSTSASGQFPYAILPELLNADVKDLKIAFYAYWNNAKPSSPANYACVVDQYYGVLKIGVVDSPVDINKTNKFNNVTEVAAVRCKGPKEPEYFVVDMSSYEGSGKYIVFYQDTAKNNYMMIDNLAITLATDPQQVTDVEASDMTLTGAKLTWKENGKATKWEVKVFAEVPEDIDAADAVFTQIVTTKEALVTGLNHSTQYFAYVRSIQDNGNGAWGNTSFWTECDKVSLPYVQDFNSFAHGSSSLNTLTPCFEVGDSYGGTSPYYYNYVKNGQATTSSTSPWGPGTSNYYVDHTYGNDPATNIFYMYAPKNKYALLVLPEIDGDLANMTMRFYGCYSTAFTAGGSSGGAIEVAIMNADGTFTHVENLKLSKVKEWEEFNVNFPSEIHSGRIALRINNTADWRAELGSTYSSGATFYMYIDDIKVQEIPQCQKVLDIEVEDIDSISAKISWDASEASKWNLKVSTVELADPDAATADIFDGAIETTPSKQITDLPDNTTFYVYVQTVRPEKSCVGEWSLAKSFKTLCRKQDFPYVEDFESYNTGTGNLPECSYLCGQDADHSYISTKGTGNKALYLRQVTKAHNNYFAFPALNVDSVKRLQLSMQVYTGGTTTSYTYQFEVGVMTDPNDPSTFVATHHEALAGASTPYDRVYTFEGYAGDETGTKFGTFIALKALEYKNATGTEYAGTMYIDNVSIDFIETCVAPVDLQTDSVGTYGAKLIWNTDDKTASHRVRLYVDPAATPDSEDFAAEKVVNDSVVLFEGLNSLTKYYTFVRKECAENDMSKWSSAFEFQTECPEIRELPYVEGFESYDAQTIPSCWTALDNGTNAKCRVYANSTSITYASTGEKGLYINYASVGSSSGNSYYSSSIVTPPLDVENLKELLVYFDYTSISRAGGSLKIEAVSDDTPDAQAIVITQINDIPTKEWRKAYILLKDYYTSVQPYNRLRFTPMTQGTSVAIDELVITKELNTILPVNNMKLLMLTESSIKFSFVEPTPGINQWQVAYVAAGGDIADATIKTIDETVYTIEGLAANTSYDIYVRGNVEGDAWVGPLTATTIQAPAPLPLITGFEDEADNAMWNIYNLYGDGIHTYPNFWIVGKADSCAGTGENALFITNDSASYIAFDKNDGHNMDPVKYAYQGSNIVATSYVWATRNIKIEAAGTYKFSFKYKVPKCYSSDGLYAQLIPAGATYKAGNATLISGATRSGSATTATDANGCYLVMGKQNEVADWTWFKQSLDIEEPGIYTLAIYWYNPSAGEPYATPAAIDSVIVEEYLCTTPKNIEFVERKANEVSLKWFGGKCKNFEYVLSRYAKLGNPALIDVEDKVAYGTLTEGPAITLTNLAPQTNYSFYVRTICEDGLTDWIEYDFVTPCALEELPYTEIFAENPECWVLSAASVTTQKYKTPDMTTADVWTCLQLNKGGMAILPELNVPLNKVQMDLEVFNTTKLGAISIGVMDNTWDLSTYKEIKFFQTSHKLSSSSTAGNPLVLEPFSHMFNLYQGEGKVLAIKNAADDPIYVKVVTLTELPDCVKPQQVELTYPTESAFTVNWIAGLEEAWEIKINDSIIENVTTNPYRISNLEQGTVYKVAVRALCDAEHTSDWSIPATIQTTCGVNPMPMFEDFSNLPKPVGTADLRRAQLICWDNMVSEQKIDQVFAGNDHPFVPASSVYAGDVWVSNWISALGDYAQLHSYRRDQPKYRHKWFVSPQYAIDANATLSFDIRCSNNVGNAPAPSSDRTMVAISTDNGATWKKEDATVIEGIDSVYTTKYVSLAKYAGQAIRIAFYDENITSSHKIGEMPFVLIDNVRMNCSENYAIEDNACQGYEYENNGFKIAPEDLPIAGQDSTYYRFAVNQEGGCDSIIALKLTTHMPETTVEYATICQGEYYQFGTRKLTEPNPEGKPYFIPGVTEFGCDKTVFLYLTVNPSDTTNIDPIVVKNDDLPYEVDATYTIPADAPIGEPFDTIVKVEGCHFNHYFVTVERCAIEVSFSDKICEGATYEGHGFVITPEEMPAAGESKEFKHEGRSINDCDSVTILTLTVKPVKETILEESICEDESIFEGYNFSIVKAEWPAVGESKAYYQYLSTAEECDSTVILTLTVTKADTLDIHVVVLSDELPKVVDQYYTVPADAPIDEPFDVLLKADGCAYNHYFITVAQCKDSVGYADEVCEGSRYEGYGFVIEPSQLPAAGSSKLFGHVDKTALQCDSMTTLTLTVKPVKRTPLEDNICEDQAIYEGYNFAIEKAEWPAAGESKDFFQYLNSAQGCDSIVTLTLTVNKADTTEIIVEKLNTELPFEVDQYYTVPANTPVGGPYVEVIKTGDCAYNRYVVTIAQCTGSEEPEDEICENAESYNGYGFTIAKAEFPAANSSKNFERSEMIDGCLITYTLTLTVNKADTIDQTPVVINADKLPYEVDQYYTVPENTPVGGPYEEVIEIADCAYNRYFVTIHDEGFGLMQITDAVDYIEVYDALGRKVRTLRQGDEQYQFTTGVYMLRTVMKSGNVVNRKVTLK